MSNKTTSVLAPGQVIAGRYEIKSSIDVGGAGQVFKARQNELDIFRAIKVLRPEHAETKEYLEAFHKEITILAGLTHQNIVKIIDAGQDTDRGFTFLVMEFIAGEHLDKTARKLSSSMKLFSLFSEVLQGLEYLHERKVLHSDLKPSNILVEIDAITQQQHVKIADLGAAKNLSSLIPHPEEFSLTTGSSEMTGMIGTRKYAPREYQRDINTNPITKQELVDSFPYFDLHCLGATFAECVSTRTIQKHIQDELDLLLAQPLPYLAKEHDQWLYLDGFIRRLLSPRGSRESFHPVHEAHEAFLRLDATRSLPERVPELTDVGVFASIVGMDGVNYFSKRSYHLILHPTFQRLQKLNQLSFVDLIYPYGRHSRFSHSLETFSLAKRVAIQLLRDTTFRLHVTPEDISAFLCAALLHDVGHYPLAHVIEDIPTVKFDYELVEYFLNKPGGLETGHGEDDVTSLAYILKTEWEIDAKTIQHLVSKRYRDELSIAGRFFQQLLSGPLDIDKMAYVFQDRVFTGVPFGRGVDVDFLISSFVALSPRQYKPKIEDITLGIDSKGVVAATGLIAARAALYGRVYWHHTNRAIMAMIKYVASHVFSSKAVTFEQYINDTWHFSEYEALRYLVGKLPQSVVCSPEKNPVMGILDGSRDIYKRLVSYSHHRSDEKIRSIYRNLLQLDDGVLETKRVDIKMYLVRLTNVSHIEDYEVLVDVPKVQKEEDALSNIYVVDQYNRNDLRPLNEVTQIIDPLFLEFSHNVKKARVFISPRLRDILRSKGKESEAISEVNIILSPR